MATLDDILSSVRRRAGRLARAGGAAHDALPDNVESDNLQIRRYAEEAAAEIARRTDVFMNRGTVAVVAATANYGVPASVGAILRCAFTPTSGTTRLLNVVDGEVARQRATASQVKSETPTQIGFFASELWLNDTPNAAGTLEVLYRPLSIIAESESWTSDEAPSSDLLEYMPPGLVMAIEDWCLYRWFRDIGRFDIAEANKGGYEETLRRHATSRRTPHTSIRAVNQLI